MREVVAKKTTYINEEQVGSPIVSYLIFFFLGVIEVLLVFRLAFKLAGANPASAFANFIYTLSQIFVNPFAGIFPAATSQGIVTVAIFEPAVVVAIVVYAIIAWGIDQLIVILSGQTPA